MFKQIGGDLNLNVNIDIFVLPNHRLSTLYIREIFKQ